MITEETYKWIEKLDDTIDITDYNRLVLNYFIIDKSDWYEEIEGKKKWDDLKVKQFWFLIRKYTMSYVTRQKLINFENFIFPDREYYSHQFNSGKRITQSMNFWRNIDDKKISQNINFKNAVFLGDFYIYKAVFKGFINFENTKFLGEFSITQNCTFEGEINFENAIFNENTFFHNQFFNKINFYQAKFKSLANFDDSIFKQSINFENTYFEKDAYFNGCKFNENTNFEGADFSQQTLFIDTEFKKEVSFSGAEFKGDTNFYRTEFYNLVNFENSIFLGDKKFYFLDLEGDNLKLSFKNTIFSKSILFRRINFTNTTFLESDLTDLKFRECEWGNESRIILHDEKSIDFKEKSNLKSLEALYRQLKKNFETTKNWELSGKAYVSEMEMRKRRLWLERNYYQWFIYKFYDVFGGYTQDFGKPIVSLVGLILVFSGLYFFIDYDILKAFQRGVKGALPYMQIDTENPFTGYWLILRNLELVLGGTFLAFFILALRKRFKQ